MNALCLTFVLLFQFIASTSGSTKTRVTQAPRIVTTTTSAPSNEEDNATDGEATEENEDLPAVKQPVRPSVSGRKVVTRVTTRPTTEADRATPSIVTSTPGRRIVSKTRIENMPVPRPVSFSRKSSKTTSVADEEPAIETTTLEPIPVPAFEPTRRSAKPIIQSISVDNEDNDEETNESELPPKRSVKNAERIYTSDLAKFSSRVRYAERPSNRQRSSLSSYSPPLLEPNNESFIEINRIK